MSPARLLLLLCAVALPAAAAAAAAARDEERVRDLVRRLPPVDQDALAKATFAGTYKPSDLVDFSTRQGRLVAAFHLPPALDKQFAGGAPLLIALDGSPHAWAVSRRRAGTLDDKLSLVTLACYAPDIAWPFNRFTLASDGTGVMVSGTQMSGRPIDQPYVSLNQGERQVRLAWRTPDGDKFVAKRLDLADAGQLQSRAPEVYEQYLTPVFRQLGPGLAAADVYRAFEQIPANPAVTRRVAPLVARLAAADAGDREAASAALRAIGRPAVLATLRLDPAGLTPEQADRLAAFHAADGWCHVPDVEAARRDVVFLTACLQDEDPRVRSAADTSLAAIRATRGLGR